MKAKTKKQFIYTSGDVCELSGSKWLELRALGFIGIATFVHERLIDRVHPTATVKMRNRKTGERVHLKYIGPGDRNVYLYSKTL